MPSEPQPKPPTQVPPHVLAASHAALDLHDPALAVAVLAADSLLDGDLSLPAGADRRVTFDLDDLCVDVTLWRDPAGRARMQVQVYRDGDPETSSSAAYDFLELVQPPHRTKAVLTGGEARLTDVPPGLTSLVLPGQTGSPSTPLRTAWFTV